MPFEPKLVRPDETPLDPALEARIDDDFEAGLPGDLEALACQLREDAARLSSLYPADGQASERVIEPAARAVSRWAVWKWVSYGSGAALLLAVAIALPWVVPSDSARPDFANGAKSASEKSPRNGSDDGSTGETHRLARVHDEPGELHNAARSNESPALLLLNVSGPELEGLFDLWEADSVEQIRISI